MSASTSNTGNSATPGAQGGHSAKIMVVDDDVRLRKLIEPDPSSPLYIQTVWGLGYVFIPEGQPR